MHTAYVVVTLTAVAANAFSGIAALLHWTAILPGWSRRHSPQFGLANGFLMLAVAALALNPAL